MKFTPRPYQQEALDWLTPRPKAALFLDVGLGKTSITLLDMAISLAMGYTKRWLVIAPLRVCQTTWPQELKKWDFAHDLNYLEMSGPQRNRAQLHERALSYPVTILNVENLPKLVKHFNARWPFDGVVLDESSKFKDSSTQRWKALRTVTGHIDRLRLLTGSPCAQNLMNLWSQVYLIDRGERLSRTLTGFKHSYFQQADWHGYEWEPRPGARDRILDRISDVCLTMEPPADTPEPMHNRLEIQLPLKTLADYRKLEKEYFLEVLNEDEGITAVNAATLTNKLSQIANGFAYWDTEQGGRQVEYFHKAKVDAVQEFAEEHGAPFLLGLNFREDQQRLLKHFGDRMEIFDGSALQMKRWAEGKFQILGMHPQSGGHGVDGLQHATCTVLWYSPPWSREQFDQMNGRVVGARQKHTVFEHRQSVVHILVAKGTIDETAHSVLFSRGEQQSDFLKQLRLRAAHVTPSG